MTPPSDIAARGCRASPSWEKILSFFQRRQISISRWAARIRSGTIYTNQVITKQEHFNEQIAQFHNYCHPERLLRVSGRARWDGGHQAGTEPHIR
jgi:hypothetical protein